MRGSSGRDGRDLGIQTDLSTESSNDNPTLTDMGAQFARVAVWLLRMQAVLTVAAAIALAVISGRQAAIAGLAGGGIGLVLTALAALRAGMAAGSGEPTRIVVAFYRAMAMKLFVAVVLFVIVAKWFPVYFGPVVFGYIATLVAYWVALLRMGRMSTIPTQHDD